MGHAACQPIQNFATLVEILTFFNYSYFARNMTRKPKIVNLTKVTIKLCCINFWSQKSGIVLFCGDVTSHENQESLKKKRLGY